MISPYALVTAITAAAISISKGKSADELSLLGAMFSQLGDTLGTIATQKSLIEAKLEKKTDCDNTIKKNEPIEKDNKGNKKESDDKSK